MYGRRHRGEEGIKALIDPSQAQYQKMVKAVFTPAHADALKTLLNEPFTSTFDHPRAPGTVMLFKVLITDMAMMSLKIGLHLRQGH